MKNNMKKLIKHFKEFAKHMKKSSDNFARIGDREKNKLKLKSYQSN
jgi:hypothetical protein